MCELISVRPHQTLEYLTRCTQNFGAQPALISWPLNTPSRLAVPPTPTSSSTLFVATYTQDPGQPFPGPQLPPNRVGAVLLCAPMLCEVAPVNPYHIAW